jgi:hypothetical protein
LASGWFPSEARGDQRSGQDLALIHASQVEKLNPVEAKKALAELEAKKAKRTSDVLPKPSPIAEARVPAQSNGKAAPVH